MNEAEVTALRNRVSPEPLVPGGTNFVTHRLDHSDPDRWEYRTSASYRGITFFMLFVGILIAGCGIFAGEGMGAERLLPLLFGAFFLLTGLVLYLQSRRRARFDFGLGCYWRDRRTPKNGTPEKLRDYLPLKEVAALQIVDELCRGNKGSTYYSYELNLVKADGSRLNVIDHGGRKAIEEDARKLAGRLHVPVLGLSDGKNAAPGPKRRSRKVGNAGILVGSIFVAAGLVMSWFLILSPVLLHFTSQKWEEVPATIVSSELARSRSSHTGPQKGSTTYRIAISYDYRYGGKSYRGDRYDITRSRSSSNIGVDEMRLIVRHHPVGMHVICLVNPDNPGQALIDRTLPRSFYLFSLWFPLPFLAFGLWAVIAGIKSR